MTQRQRSFIQTFYGDPNLTTSNNRSGTVTACGDDGTVLVFNSSAEGGFTGMSAASVVTAGVIGGATVSATSVSMLTGPGQLLTGSSPGQPNLVLPGGTVGQVLQITSPGTGGTGLSWVNPAAASGTPNPTPGTLAQRTNSGALQAVGFIAVGGDIIPSSTGADNVGNTGALFASVNALAGNFTAVTTPTIQTTSGSLAVNGFTTVVLSAGGVSALTVSSSALLAGLPLAATTMVIGGAYLGANTWTLTVVSGQLTLSSWNGSSYVARQSFATG